MCEVRAAVRLNVSATVTASAANAKTGFGNGGHVLLPLFGDDKHRLDMYLDDERQQGSPGCPISNCAGW